MTRSSVFSVAAASVLALVTIVGCDSQAPQPSTTDAQTNAPASTATELPSTNQPSGSPEGGQAEQTSSPAVSQSSTPAELTPLPATSGEANVSAFKAEITDASFDETKTQTGHELKGSPGIRVNLKLTNVTDNPADASILSFPTAPLDGTQVSGMSDNQDPAKTVFNTIEPGQSQELSVIFPTESQPSEITVTVQDPANPETSTTLTHSIKK